MKGNVWWKLSLDWHKYDRSSVCTIEKSICKSDSVTPVRTARVMLRIRLSVSRQWHSGMYPTPLICWAQVWTQIWSTRPPPPLLPQLLPSENTRSCEHDHHITAQPTEVFQQNEIVANLSPKQNKKLALAWRDKNNIRCQHNGVSMFMFLWFIFQMCLQHLNNGSI